MSLPTTPPRVMRGANGSVAGASGYPPIPAAADNVKYLKGDGTWSALANASAATDAEASAGTSTTTFVTPANAALAVASGRNGLAPAQALSGNGTATFGTATLASSLGTTAHTIALRLSVPAAQQSGFILTLAGNGSAPFNDLYCYLSAGSLVLNYRFASLDHVTVLSSGFVTVYGGTTVDLQLVFDGTNALAYVNSVLVSTTALAVNLTGATALALGSSTWVGTIRLLGIYNRALSAAEVLALYRESDPASADYNAASNTSLLTGNNSTFDGTPSAWNLSNGNVSGGALNFITGTNPYATVAGFEIRTGRRYRFIAVISAISGGQLQYYNGAAYINFAASPGTYIVEFTGAGNYPLFTLNAGVGITSAALDTVTLFNAGLLLAPDAAQSGGGLTWYDTSGNAANITLPATGVTWNVPTSGNVTSSSSLNLRAGGTAQNITLVPSTTGGVLIGGGTFFPYTTGALALNLNATSSVQSEIKLTNSTTGNGAAAGMLLSCDGNNGYIWNSQATGTLNFGTANAQRAQFLANGRFLLGTTTDSANGILQLASSTAASGGIGFGTDTQLYRIGPAALRLDAPAGDLQFQLARNGTVNGGFLVDGATLYVQTQIAGMGMIFKTAAGTTALTLSSAQVATFAAAVIGSTTITATTQFQSDVYRQFNGNRALLSFSGVETSIGSGATGDTTRINANGIQALRFDTTLTAAFAGALRLNNAYVAGAVVGTGYVTIQDSTGTTYKVPVLL